LQNIKVLLSWVVRPWLTIDTSVPPLVGCTQQLIQYIRSYRQYLEVGSSIRKAKKEEKRNGINNILIILFLLTLLPFSLVS